MIKIYIILLGLLITSIFCLGQESSLRVHEIRPEIKVVISQVKDVVEGKPVVIKCEIINTTASVQKLEFTEWHQYHKKLPYATCITAAIYDSKGKSLCKVGTQYVAWSTIFEDKDSQYITIKPKDKIVRELSVSDVSYDCTCDYKNGFKKGKYRVQVFVHSIPSNILEVKVNRQKYSHKKPHSTAPNE